MTVDGRSRLQAHGIGNFTHGGRITLGLNFRFNKFQDTLLIIATRTLHIIPTFSKAFVQYSIGRKKNQTAVRIDKIRKKVIAKSLVFLYTKR